MAVKRDPRDRLLDQLDEFDRRLRNVERSKPTAIVFTGPRTDTATDGVVNGEGPRVRIGLLSDGTYGVERWQADGTRETPTWV